MTTAVISLTAGGILAIVVVVKLVLRVLSWRYERQNKAHSYMPVHFTLDNSIKGQWKALQNTIPWVEERIKHPKVSTGDHVRPVTDKEIDLYLKYCDELSKKISEAIHSEHKSFKKFSRRHGKKLCEKDHSVWFDIDDEIPSIKSKFNDLRPNPKK